MAKSGKLPRESTWIKEHHRAVNNEGEEGIVTPERGGYICCGNQEWDSINCKGIAARTVEA